MKEKGRRGFYSIENGVYISFNLYILEFKEGNVCESER